jgi:hypothetical protein
LRKKRPQGGEPDASQANGGVVQANGSVEAVEVIAEPAPDSALEAGETETLSAE